LKEEEDKERERKQKEEEDKEREESHIVNRLVAGTKDLYLKSKDN